MTVSDAWMDSIADLPPCVRHRPPWRPRRPHEPTGALPPLARAGRNLIAVPRERLAAVTMSATMRVAAAAGRLFGVNASTITEHAYAEACRAGGACCDGSHHCCSRRCVDAWLGKHLVRWASLPPSEQARHPDPQRYTRVRWERSRDAPLQELS